MEIEIRQGTIFRLYGEWLDEINYGVFIALKDLKIKEGERDGDEACDFVKELESNGYIQKLNIPEILISEQ